MMIKIKFGIAILFLMLGIISCKKDDEVPTVIPPRDRGLEAERAEKVIDTFLRTHFYNYEEFEEDPENFKLKFGKIEGDNADKTPLIEQVSVKKVTDRVDKKVTYNMYYLIVREGKGEKPHFSDYTLNTYDGRLLNLELFDSSVIPVRFDLNDIVAGLQMIIPEFRGAGEVISNSDGTLTFKDYGIGAVFIPSGLGYYQFPPAGNLDPYDQLIFSFELFSSEISDHDNDGIPSYMEDINGNKFLLDDNTDGTGGANYQDNDDDGDGRLTKFEIEIVNGVVTFPDKNGNGVADYLDPSI